MYKCNSNLVMHMVHRLLLHNETRKNNSGLINLPNVIQKFPDLGSDKPLPKVSIAVAINLVCTPPTAQQ